MSKAKNHTCDHDHKHDHDHNHKHDHNDNHVHSNSHSSGHGHHHHAVDVENLSTAFMVGGILNLFFSLFEFGFGVFSGSVSLVADAVHNFSDVITIFLSWLGFKLNKSKASPNFTYGLKKMSLMITFFNSTTLVLSLIYILYEAYERFLNPQVISANSVIIIASCGLVINFFTAFLFRNNKSDINVKGAYLHMMMDAFISLAVAISGLIIKYTGLKILDPIMACVIVVFIARGAWLLMKESFVLLIGGVPLSIQITDVEKHILNFTHENSKISSLHDLHVWAMSSSAIALTAHLKMGAENHPGDLFLKKLSESLKEKFNITHSTLQIEIGDSATENCSLEHSC